MTDQTARKVANVALTVAVVGATYVILKTPALRRLAFGLAVSALTGTVPAWLASEVQHAWMESGHRAV
jgi:hypothetical protein